MSTKNRLNEFEKKWYRRQRNYILASIIFGLILIVMAIILGFKLSEPDVLKTPYIKIWSTIFVFSLVGASLFGANIYTIFQKFKNGPYAERIKFFNLKQNDILVSYAYSQKLASTIILLISRARIVRLGLSGRRTLSEIRQHIYTKLLSEHGDLSNFTNKNLTKEIL